MLLWPCPDCDFVGATPAGRDRHRNAKHGYRGVDAVRQQEGAHSCGRCQRRFHSKGGLTRHWNKEHKGHTRMDEIADAALAEQVEPGPTVADVVDVYRAAAAAEALRVKAAHEPENDRALIITEPYRVELQQTVRRLIHLALLIDPAHADEARGLIDSLL